jgi:hypothetical protein
MKGKEKGRQRHCIKRNIKKEGKEEQRERK